MNRPKNLDQQTYEQYLGFYIIGGIGLLVTLLFPLLEILYALYFFGVHAFFLFTQDQPEVDPEHSTVTHYNRYSSWNWFNYAVGAFIAISAFLYLFSPASKPVTVFVIWSLALLYISRNRQRIANRLGRDLTISYLVEQFPELSKEKILDATKVLFKNPNTSIPKLASTLGVGNQKAKELRYLFSVYIRNLE